MGKSVPNLFCPKCGQETIFINTDDNRKPAGIKCRRLSCGWKVDLKPYWPKSSVTSKTKREK